MIFIGLYIDHSKKLAGELLRMFDDFGILVVVLDLVSLNLMAVVVFLSCARKHERFNNILNILNALDQKVHHNVPEMKAKAKIIFMLIITLILIVWNGISDYIRSFRSGSEDKYHFMSLCYIPPLSMHFAQVAMFLHFTHVTQSVATRFSIVNLRVKQEVMRNRQVQPMNIQRPSNVNVPQSDRGVSSTREINVFYGDQLLAVLFTAFVHITICLFYLHLALITEETIATTSLAAWVITYIAYVLLLFHASTLVHDLADETAPMICKLINTDLDPTLVKCLEEFLLQLGKHKPRLSALGFFDFQYSTLTGMSAAQPTCSASSSRHVPRHTRQQLGVVHRPRHDTPKKNKACDLSPYIQTMELKHL
ncbi:gustatory receptor [Homalodisca vitripennis]|nr:gustatory receptor [Homalodisca vitripennis]